MKKSVCCILLFLIPLMAAGCWDMIDIEKYAFVTALGIDSLEEQSAADQRGLPHLNPPPRMHLTMEIFSPRLFKMEKDKHSIVIHQSADALMEALKLAQSQIPNRITLVHLRLLIIGEEYARQGIKEVIETLRNDPSIASRFRLVFLQEGRAEAALESRAIPEGSITEVFAETGERDPAYGFHTTVNFNYLKEQLMNSNGTAYCTRLHLSENRWTQKAGAAVLKDWKLVGWLNPFEVRSANWITGKINQTSVSVENEEMRAVYHVTNVKVRIKTTVGEGQPRFLVSVKTDGVLSYIDQVPGGTMTNEYLKKIETAMAQKVSEEIRLAVEKAQKEFQADYLGFNQALENSHPAVYRSLDWEEVFPTVPVDVEVEARITRLGAKK